VDDFLRGGRPAHGQLRLHAMAAVPDGSIAELSPDTSFVRLSAVDRGHGQGRSHITPPDRTIFLQIGSGRRNRSRPVDGAWSRRTVGGCAAHAERARHGDHRRTMVADRSNPRPDSPRATDHPPAGPVLKVICVDDDAIVRASTAEILADLSHDVIQTVSGEEALFGAPPRALRSADHRSSDTRPTRLGRDRGGRTAAAGYACTTYHRVRGQPCWSRTWA
jgi:hypothetical protein